MTSRQLRELRNSPSVKSNTLETSKCIYNQSSTHSNHPEVHCVWSITNLQSIRPFSPLDSLKAHLLLSQNVNQFSLLLVSVQNLLQVFLPRPHLRLHIRSHLLQVLPAFLSVRKSNEELQGVRLLPRSLRAEVSCPDLGESGYVLNLHSNVRRCHLCKSEVNSFKYQSPDWQQCKKGLRSCTIMKVTLFTS